MPGSRVDGRWRSTLTTSWPLSRRSRPTHLPSSPLPPVISTRMKNPFPLPVPCQEPDGRSRDSFSWEPRTSTGQQFPAHIHHVVVELVDIALHQRGLSARAGRAQVPPAVLLIHEVPPGELDAVAERRDDL